MLHFYPLSSDIHLHISSHSPRRHLFSFFGIQILLQADTQFFPERLEFFKVLIVLATVLDFRLDSCNDSRSARWLLVYPSPCASMPISGKPPKEVHTLKDPHGGRKVVDSSGSLQRGSENGR
jgi:hypothetical protein